MLVGSFVVNIFITGALEKILGTIRSL
jgi:hypothetical protein